MITTELRLTVNAPREKVFHALTDPALVARWWFPGTRAEIDLHPGGRYRFAFSFNGQAMAAHGEYREIEAPDRLTFTFGWEGSPSDATLVTVELHEQGGQTELVLTHTGFADQADADNHRQGWSDCLGRMVAMFAVAA